MLPYYFQYLPMISVCVSSSSTAAADFLSNLLLTSSPQPDASRFRRGSRVFFVFHIFPIRTLFLARSRHWKLLIPSLGSFADPFFKVVPLCVFSDDRVSFFKHHIFEHSSAVYRISSQERKPREELHRFRSGCRWMFVLEALIRTWAFIYWPQSRCCQTLRVVLNTWLHSLSDSSCLCRLIHQLLVIELVANFDPVSLFSYSVWAFFHQKVLAKGVFLSAFKLTYPIRTSSSFVWPGRPANSVWNSVWSKKKRH